MLTSHVAEHRGLLQFRPLTDSQSSKTWLRELFTPHHPSHSRTKFKGLRLVTRTIRPQDNFRDLERTSRRHMLTLKSSSYTIRTPARIKQSVIKIFKRARPGFVHFGAILTYFTLNQC